MTTPLETGFTLALDTAIGTGSAAIFREKKIIDELGPNQGMSRSETLSIGITSLVSRNHLSIGDLSRVVVSLGPGSFTGIRLGLAFAKGMAASTQASISGQAILQAIAAGQPHRGKVAVIAPIGRADILLQSFDSIPDIPIPLTEASVVPLNEFHPEVLVQTIQHLVFHPECPSWAIEALETVAPESESLKDSVAVLIGKADADAKEQAPLEPIYIQRSAFQTSKRIDFRP